MNTLDFKRGRGTRDQIANICSIVKNGEGKGVPEKYLLLNLYAEFGSVQSLSCVSLFVTPWTAALQASLSFTIALSLLKLTSIEPVMPSNHLILCRPLLFLLSIFPSIRVSLMSQLFASGGQSTGVSASASVLLMNVQD